MMQPLTIITSGAYVNSEIAAEYGVLPPSFLAIGHARLYAMQVAQASKLGGTIVLTLPESFTLDPWDEAALETLRVQIVKVPDDLSLGNSILYALLVVGAQGPIRILHGDTVFLHDLPETLDVASVASSSYSYSWGLVDQEGRFRHQGAGAPADPPILTGFFAFSNAAKLCRALTMSRGEFLEALNRYQDETHPIGLTEIGGWLDCGHLQTYYLARAQVTTTRSFNSLKISGRTVEKSSTNPLKVGMEAAWFKGLPEGFRLYTPAYLGSRGTHDSADFSYSIAYEYSPTLHDLFVFGRLDKPVWRMMFRSLFEFLTLCRTRNSDQPPRILDTLVVNKTMERLELYSRATGLDLKDGWTYAGRPMPGLDRIVEQTSALLDVEGRDLPGIMHGDLCFSNIFYDFRQQSIKVVDPRGSLNGRDPSIFGDLRYDLAKLNHSIEGYDFILANRYTLETNRDRDVTITFPQSGTAAWLRDVASEFSISGHRLGEDEIKALTVHLFLSMLPLHADRPDRQLAFLANALRLFSQLDG